MNIDNRIVLNPNLIEPNLIVHPASSNSIDDGRLESDRNVLCRIPQQPVNQNVVTTNERQLMEQIIHSSYHRATEDYNSNGTDHTMLISRDDDTHSRYSPPPPYELCVSDANVQPMPYPQQISHFPQHQNIQYLHQQRLQYPQQESLQYHEGMSYYPQPPIMPYPYQRDRNFPASYEPPPIKQPFCNGCNGCTICFFFCVLPICLLLYILYATSS